jgi:hypothetical protein
MYGYSEIQHQSDADRLVAAMDGFFDSLLKEIHLVTRAAVLESGNLACAEHADGRFLIQSQSRGAVPAVELLALDVRELRGGAFGSDSDSGSISVQRDRLTEFPRIDCRWSDWSFVCSRLLYRFRPNWHGRTARFGSELPHPGQVAGIPLGGGWIQCPTCMDAFQRPPHQSRSLCPTCSCTVELELDAG